MVLLKNWFDLNKLTLNISKTKFIVFGNRLPNTISKLMINEIEIERVSAIKFLGVIIDNDLNWKPHISYTKNKISKSIAILYKVKDLLNEKSLYTLYCSLVLPYITYCVEVWGNTYKTNTNSIFMLQKRAIRIVKKTNYREPTNSLFIELKALKFKELVELKTLQIMYKANNHQLPESIQGLFTERECQHDLRGTCMFKKNQVRTNAKYHCISVKGVILWNSCQEELKICGSLSKLKKLFKNKTLKLYETI